MSDRQRGHIEARRARIARIIQKRRQKLIAAYTDALQAHPDLLSEIGRPHRKIANQRKVSHQTCYLSSARTSRSLISAVDSSSDRAR